MFHFPRYTLAYASFRRNRKGFPIRKSPDRRLIVTSPKLIADILRPSSLCKAKASTIHPYVPARNAVHRCTIFECSHAHLRACLICVCLSGDEKTSLRISLTQQTYLPSEFSKAKFARATDCRRSVDLRRYVVVRPSPYNHHLLNRTFVQFHS